MNDTELHFKILQTTHFWVWDYAYKGLTETLQLQTSRNLYARRQSQRDCIQQLQLKVILYLPQNPVISQNSPFQFAPFVCLKMSPDPNKQNTLAFLNCYCIALLGYWNRNVTHTKDPCSGAGYYQTTSKTQQRKTKKTKQQLHMII